MTKCECGKEVTPEEAYRCRICDEWFCEDCSLKHFGLYVDKKGDVKYKNIFITMLWLIRKRILGR
tara:strand:+ start:15 stop:209 length:195 start_codon:yes stop_codon:yes gene_type:complete